MIPRFADDKLRCWHVQNFDIMGYKNEYRTRHASHCKAREDITFFWIFSEENFLI